MLFDVRKMLVSNSYLCLYNSKARKGKLLGLDYCILGISVCLTLNVEGTGNVFSFSIPNQRASLQTP